MDLTKESSADLINVVASLEKLTARVLKDAVLSSQQRTDLENVLRSTQVFQTFASDEQVIIDNPAEAEVAELQRVRHQLLNNLNIIVGFTQIIVRDLPDNLLIQMGNIRKINTSGRDLIERVSNLR